MSVSRSSTKTAGPLNASPECVRIDLEDRNDGPSRLSFAQLCERLSPNQWWVGILVSLITHTSILILLAIWTLRGQGLGFGESALEATLDGNTLEPVAVFEPEQLGSGSEAAMESMANSAELTVGPSTSVSGGAAIGPLLNETLSAPVSSEASSSEASQVISATSNSTVATLGTSDVSGRSPGPRRQLALQQGGSLESEAAVELALEWLAAHQRPNGSWSLLHTKDECKGACTHEGSKDRYDPAATGLALLAFLGAGYTHRDGKYNTVVRNGVYFLIQIQEETNQGGSFLYGSPQGMYNHGIASFALCEAYQLSQDESLKAPAQRAVNFILAAQNKAGGWGYLPKQPGDLTITAWQLMALKSAYTAGLTVSTSSILRVDNFLDSQTDAKKTFYGYAVPGKRPTCTAIGLLLRLFRGWRATDPRLLEGINYLESEGLSEGDMYRNYYITLLFFHSGGGIFNDWNKPLREYLIRTQNRSGHAAGSWYFEDKYGDQGGRLYNTAMCAMMLEVYYRFAPLYRNVDRPFEL